MPVSIEHRLGQDTDEIDWNQNKYVVMYAYTIIRACRTGEVHHPVLVGRKVRLKIEAPAKSLQNTNQA